MRLNSFLTQKQYIYLHLHELGDTLNIYEIQSSLATLETLKAFLTSRNRGLGWKLPSILTQLRCHSYCSLEQEQRTTWRTEKYENWRDIFKLQVNLNGFFFCHS
jgi:hypothetical protein